MREYTEQFKRLSHFAYHMIDTSEKKNRRYHSGLSLSLQRSTYGHINQSFKALIGMANGFEEINRRERSDLRADQFGNSIEDKKSPISTRRVQKELKLREEAANRPFLKSADCTNKGNSIPRTIRNGGQQSWTLFQLRKPWEPGQGLPSPEEDRINGHLLLQL